MGEIGYPFQEFEYHKRQHKLLVVKLTVLQSASTRELLDYVREWLLRHILAVDSKIGAFLKHRTEDCSFP